MNAAARELASCWASRQRLELAERRLLGASRKLEARGGGTERPIAEGPSTNKDTPRTVASALLSSVRGCHAGAFAVPMSKYSACKVSYMCLDTSAGTPGNRGGARPSFRMRGPICAGPYLMPRAAQILCSLSLLRQLMWRYRATTYRKGLKVNKLSSGIWIQILACRLQTVTIGHKHNCHRLCTITVVSLSVTDDCRAARIQLYN